MHHSLTVERIKVPLLQEITIRICLYRTNLFDLKSQGNYFKIEEKHQGQLLGEEYS